MKLNKESKDFLMFTGRIASITAAGCALWFSQQSRFDKLENKIDALGMVSIKDKEIIENRITALEYSFKEGKEKANRELAQITNRIFQIYGVLPKPIQIEQEP